MDPLSITSGIITFLDAGGQIAKGLRKLIQLKEAPDALLALNNELGDFQSVVQDVDDLLQHQSASTNIVLPSSMSRTLERSKSAVLALESLIAYILTTVSANNGQLRVDRSAWLRAEHKIAATKERIRAAKVDLGSALSILTQ